MRAAFGMKRPRFLWCIVVGVVAIGSALSAQEPRTSTPEAAHHALLAEVRALRAELHEAANASIRAQLYAVGLQLAEQRTFAAERQLGDLRRELADVRREIEGEQARVRHLQASLLQTVVTEQTAIRQTILTAEAHIEETQRRALQIQSAETELETVVRDTRARWDDFNAKLGTLERSLPETVHR